MRNTIDDLIQAAKNREPDARGSNKKCYIIGDYALLRCNTGIDVEKLQREIMLEKALREKGVNVVQTLDYKVTEESTVGQYQVGYILQERAGGTPLHENNVGEYDRATEENKIKFHEEYIDRLKSLATESPEFYCKFIADWLEIEKSGLRMDPSKTSNFYYEKGKQINFIDVIVGGNRADGIETTCFEIATVLTGGAKYRRIESKDEIASRANEQISNIFKKLEEALVQQGMKRENVIKILSDRFPNVDFEEAKKVTEEQGENHAIEKIPSMDIIEKINPTLINKMVKLPNGTEIPARQYIQEVVTPHIPSNGKFTLKNGREISAKQYIEEFVMFEGQEKFNGDIIALLEETTKTDDGSRGQGLKQEIGVPKIKAEEQATQPKVEAQDELKKQSKKIQGADLKKALFAGKVTESERKQTQQKMVNKHKAKELRKRKEAGQNLTLEEEQLLAEDARQTQEQLIRFRQQQERQKRQSKGMGMSM